MMRSYRDAEFCVPILCCCAEVYFLVKNGGYRCRIGKLMVFIVFFCLVAAQGVWPAEAWDRTRVIAVARSLAIEHGLDPDFVQAIVQVESNYNVKAVNLNDPSYGVMQVSLLVGRTYNKRITNRHNIMVPYENLLAGVRFLKHLSVSVGGDLAEIAQAYNLGETKYRRGVRNPKYAQRVMRAMKRIQSVRLASMTSSREVW